HGKVSEGETILRRRVGVVVPGLGRRIIDVSPGDATIEVAMAPPARLEVAAPGVVAAGAGAPVEAAAVPAEDAEFWTSDDPSTHASFARLDSVHLGPLAPGDYDVELRTDAGSRTRTLEKRRVRLAS